jgi:hypothetical protein
MNQSRELDIRNPIVFLAFGLLSGFSKVEIVQLHPNRQKEPIKAHFNSLGLMHKDI